MARLFAGDGKAVAGVDGVVSIVASPAAAPGTVSGSAELSPSREETVAVVAADVVVVTSRTYKCSEAISDT